MPFNKSLLIKCFDKNFVDEMFFDKNVIRRKTQDSITSAVSLQYSFMCLERSLTIHPSFSLVNLSVVTSRAYNQVGEAGVFPQQNFFLHSTFLPENFLFEQLAVFNLLVDRMNYAKENQLFSLKQKAFSQYYKENQFLSHQQTQFNQQFRKNESISKEKMNCFLGENKSVSKRKQLFSGRK